MITSPVFILSDFGTRDTYAAQMKAAILSFTGYGTPVVDLTHEVNRGSIIHGAFHLRAALPHLPEGSVTLAVVDPGVGSSRGGLAALWRGRYLVAPDNGLVSLLEPPVSLWKLPPPDSSVSKTFHGRDWFAPCAARLSVDPGWKDFLTILDDPVLLPRAAPVFQSSGIITAVLHEDRFGNCVLSIDSKRGIALKATKVFVSGGEVPVRMAGFYGEGRVNELMLIAGSQGFMELAVRDGSAAELLGLEPGMTVKLQTGEN